MNTSKVIPITQISELSEPQSSSDAIPVSATADLPADRKRKKPAKPSAGSERRYCILSDGSVGLLSAAAELPPNAVSFTTQEELAAVSSDWPLRRFVDVWNQIPGQRRIVRFENRNIAVRRLWRGIESLQLQPSASHKVKAKQVRQGTMAQRIIELLQAPEGVTLTALQEATGWQAHSVRGFLSGKLTKQMGLRVSSVRRNGERVYALAPQAPEDKPVQQAAPAEIA